MFMIQLLRSMKISVKLPVTIIVNLGTIFMANNITTTCCTKYMDIRYKYINEEVKDGIIKIIFVKSTKNNNNNLTKN